MKRALHLCVFVCVGWVLSPLGSVEGSKSRVYSEGLHQLSLLASSKKEVRERAKAYFRKHQARGVSVLMLGFRHHKSFLVRKAAAKLLVTLKPKTDTFLVQMERVVRHGTSFEMRWGTKILAASGPTGRATVKRLLKAKRREVCKYAALALAPPKASNASKSAAKKKMNASLKARRARRKRVFRKLSRRMILSLIAAKGPSSGNPIMNVIKGNSVYSKNLDAALRRSSGVAVSKHTNKARKKTQRTRRGSGRVASGGLGKTQQQNVQVVLGRAKIFGGLPRNLVKRVFHRAIRKFEGCYSSKLGRSKKTFTLKVAIKSSGRVMFVKSSKHASKYAAVVSCLQRQTTSLRFPAAKSASLVIVHQPITFTRKNAKNPTVRP